MTKPPATTPSGEVIPIKPPPFFRALDRLTGDADRIVRRFDEVERLFGELREGRKVELDACRRAATVSEYDEELLAKCEAALERFDPETAYEDNDREYGELRPSVIAEQIALLIDSKPTGRPPNPEVYTTMMMEELLAIEDLSLIALITACREVRQEKPYVPDISDLMPVLRRHLQAWQERQGAIFNLADESRRLMAEIGKAKEAARTRAEREEAAAKVLAVELARQKLEQARRAVIDAEDVYCEANAALRESEEAFADAKCRVLGCENDLAQAEAVVNHNATASDDGQAI